MRQRQATSPMKTSSTAHPNQQKSPGDDAAEATMRAAAERKAAALAAAAMTAATGKSHKPVYGTKPEVPDAEDDGVAWSVAALGWTGRPQGARRNTIYLLLLYSVNMFYE